ncbi:MAG: hypothetical protein BGO31_10485 [Bacteroidetes bacterium 43-16]|nr:MAG: hypothetical protein BGO31_10485 [Bacteroidetes bacterium 43-16]
MKKIILLIGLATCSSIPPAIAGSPSDSRTQMTKEVQVNMLTHRFAIAGDIYKVQKFQLPLSVTEKAEEVFNACIKEYKSIFATLPVTERALFFKENFYNEVIPIVQYFRIPEYAQMMIQHRDSLHPKPEVPDPKHHDHEEAHQHN